MSKYIRFLFPGLICLAALLAYGPSLDGPLFFDDTPNITGNELLPVAGENIDEWRRAALSSEASRFKRPLSMLSFALNYRISGSFDAWSLKVTNLVVHLVCGFFVYWLGSLIGRTPVLADRRWSPADIRLFAMGAAAVWLLHPLHVSTVLYAVQRMAQLSALFTLAGLVLYTTKRLQWSERGASVGELLGTTLWLLLLAILGFLCKENTALLPWLIAVIEVTMFQGVWCGRKHPLVFRLGWCLLLAPLALLLVAVLLSPDWLLGGYAFRDFTLGERLLTQGRVLWIYFGWLVVPDITSMGVFHGDIPLSTSLWSPATTGLAVAAWCAVVVGSIVFYRRLPLLAFSMLFFLVGHIMESTVLPLELVFEHRNYLPSVGIALGISGTLVWVAARSSAFGVGRSLTIVLAVLTALLFLRSQNWRDEVTLAQFNVVNHPDSKRANFFYAKTLLGEFDQIQTDGVSIEQKALVVAARKYYQRAHELDTADTGPLGMLLQIDYLYFPGLAEKRDWMEVLEQSAQQRPLHSSDLTALSALVGFSVANPEDATSARLANLVIQLSEKSPGDMKLLDLRYRLYRAGFGNQDDILPVLEEAVRRQSSSTSAIIYLVDYHSTRDVPAAYEAVREWLRRDPNRVYLATIKDILSP